MCGIVGYIGREDVKETILSGLEKLEYRGYDSAGIAILNGDGIHIYKDKGRITNLREVVDFSQMGTLGIGHTRWATHGIPNRVNSHPHQSSSERFTLVHNGIIENESILKKEYLQDTKFTSDTDTEVIVQLIQKFTDKDGDVPLAIRHTLSLLKGSYALAIIDSENPDVIYAAKNKSPLLIGKGEDFNLIASDAMAMINHTNEFYELQDKEFVILGRDEVSIYNLYGIKLDRETFKGEIDASDIEKGTYPHYMLKEIDEQPFVLRRIIANYQDENGKLAVSSEIVNAVKEADRLYIVACGTSYNAGLVGKSLLENISKKPTEVHISSEFVYNTPILSEKPLFIFISQSGETADSRAVLVKIKEMGYPSIAITNVKGATLYRETDYQMLLHAGPEIAVASTKAYTAQIAVLSILACTIEDDCSFDMLNELSRAASVMEGLCDNKELYENLAKEYLIESRNCFYIGRHVDYYTCLEAALKLKEISYIQAEGFAAGELKHGTIALIEDNTPVVAIITQEKINLNTRSNIKEVKARGAAVIAISMRRLSAETDQIIIDDVHEKLTPLVSAIPAQLLAYYAALYRDCDIDKPRNLAKSVTVE
ncbi:glucosamine--fructose-6-phosphate aminotransferase (isomerizing) [Dethiosulfatibacter aminovorans DSM 17477]|uniref:Glutamine--fructose-6-phosphate aminotransferase [isomerizing] n=1 Tax=Dethiosulfatibacter aminovorans DSM 17477 TaxID=1121476 RepID=A0A1M6J6L4_9FIRM|nr:glutamine--fructose-6-phosphate transaminase (isomerizing) [Dethiosulfatibacter aminovorans]SHJ42300.1 glucosamine--fructose-6-phosphate aminotransferase (isomerizing) [Dethiosulfatibacter aminovorans DSM 17477]